MKLLQSGLNGSSSNPSDSSGRSFSPSFSAQSAASSPIFHHSGSMQGLHNMHGNFNIQNMQGTLTPRNSTITGLPSSVQQPSGTLSSGRFASNNVPAGLSQVSHGHSTITNRGGMNIVGSSAYSGSLNGFGGSIPGIPSTSSVSVNRGIPGLTSPIMGNTGARITSSMGNIVGGGNIGRSINSGGGLSVSGLESRLNLNASSGSGSLGIQVPNRLMSGMLQQGTPQVMSSLGNSYSTSGGPLSQNYVQSGNSINSMGMFNDMNSNENLPFDINDFPQLTVRPSSAGGPQGQLGSLRKQSPIVQQNQEFSIQNEDFPALPGFKGGNADYAMDMHQKEQYRDNAVSMMQSQQFTVGGRASGFSLGSTTYSPHRAPQQQQHVPLGGSGGISFGPSNSQDYINGSDLYPSSRAPYHSQSQVQTNGPPSLGLRTLNSPNAVSSTGSYDHLIEKFNQQPHQLQQISSVNQSYRNQNSQSPQLAAAQASPDRFGLLGLLSVMKMNDPDLTSLALGIDPTTLGLNLNEPDRRLHKTFGSPWSNEPAKGGPEYTVPECYFAKQPPPLHQGYFAKFQPETLFYIFYSMPQDEAQLYAANELYNRRWFYHREQQKWFIRVQNAEPLVKTATYERGSYYYFDQNTWDYILKENFVLHYESIEKRPVLPQQ
ncbi:hypothetical protein GIB67_041773 [Kingdonia uniflora]|uniref:NOT2/NOT3/NOT5 C-terminal domain-containing protein n=1 Tax=Kingdonia uniflora TaxID=39325 RepID=A0A7J7N3E1_9MAGN|nr:hypothetical protein GIB67_041773 [Kingdonia uniflora]